MKKLLFAVMALITVCACQEGERQYLQWRGLSMGMPYRQFADSLAARGYVQDTAQSTPQVARFTHPDAHYLLSIAQQADTILVIEEFYTASSNDSTRNLWQQLRDQWAKELDCMPGCPKLGDDHKIAQFETKKGVVNITLKNTYKPTLTLHLDRKTQAEVRR